MIFTIYDSAGTYPVGVTANNQLKVVLPTTIGQEGYTRVVDAGGHILSFDDEGRVDAAINTCLFSDNVDGTTVDPNRWTIALTGAATVAQAGGFIILNNSAITTINTASQFSTIQYFDIMHEAYLYGHCNALANTVPISNLMMELGFNICSGLTAPTDAAIFRWTPAGEFRCLLNNNGSETQISGALAAPAANVVHHFEVKVQHGHVDFLIDGVEVASLVAAAGVANAVNAGRLPWTARVVMGASAPAFAGQLKIACVDVWRTVVDLKIQYKDYNCTLGRGSHLIPGTFLQQANHANNTSPTSATLSNTAAGYTKLGGRWQFAAPATLATDYALFGYQVPVGWNLTVHDVQITAVNTGAAVGTSATILDWSVGVEATQVSLATADTLPSIVEVRRQPIGIQSWILAAGIGVSAQPLSPHWEAGLVCHGGRWFHIIVQQFLGTATASQVIRGDVFIGGYFS